jgi:hypothetical protein
MKMTTVGVPVGWMVTGEPSNVAPTTVGAASPVAGSPVVAVKAGSGVPAMTGRAFPTPEGAALVEAHG